MTEALASIGALTGNDNRLGVFHLLCGITAIISALDCVFLCGDKVLALIGAVRLLGLDVGVVERNATVLSPLEEAGLPGLTCCLSGTLLLKLLPTVLSSDNKFGLNRARLDFVGDRNEARLGVVSY